MIIAVYAGICILASVFQSKLVYYPTRAFEDTPTSEGLDYEDVTLETGDGVKLHAWWVPVDNTVATVIVCHGNAGNISHRVGTIKIFHDLGLNVFIFDYRGYGKSEGSPTEEGTYLDAEAAWTHVTEARGVPADRVIVFGRSLGGAIAAHLAWKHPPRAVILESTFTSMPDVGSEVYPFLPVRAICRIRYDTKSIIGEIASPVLLVHSPEDDIIPFHHSGDLRDARGDAPTEFLEIRGDHNSGWQVSGKYYRDGLAKFIEGQ